MIKQYIILLRFKSFNVDPRINLYRYLLSNHYMLIAKRVILQMLTLYNNFGIA
jgi:hypothetical protein